MKMNGEQRISADRETVWRALNDPEILGRAIPGCQSVEKISDTELTAIIKAKVGPVSAKFKGKVTLTNIDRPNGYTIGGEGQGGPAGFGKGSADVALKQDGDETVLSYKASGQVGGKLAQIGARLVDGAAKKLANEFFVNLAKEIKSASGSSSALGIAAEEKGAPNSGDPPILSGASRRSGLTLNPYVWVAGLIGAVIVLLVVFNSV